jgi:heme/copper-type cytochrome/quinol oxidase subunit 1
MPRLSVWMIRSALLYLGVGITLGALMLWNKGSLFDARIWLLVSTHLEMLIVGWLVQLALGVAFWILPRFTKEPRYGNVRLGWVGFALLNTGILVVIISLLIGSLVNLQPLGRLIEVIAALTLGSVLWPRVKAFGV